MVRRVLVMLALAALVCAAIGCSHTRGKFQDGRFISKETEYVVGELPDGWRLGEVSNPGDVAFHSRDMGSTIYIDNSCKRFSDASLNTLANHLLFGFEDSRILSQEIYTLDDRQALTRVVETRLDGVLVKMGVTVLKKDTCIFDLVLLSPREHFDAAMEDYRRFVDGFHVERCP